MKLKKIITGVLAAFMLAGCAPKQQQNTTKLKNRSYNISTI